MAAPINIVLSGGYYFRSINRIVRDLSPLLHMREPAVVNVDLQRLTFIGPTALAVLVALLHELQIRKMTVDGGALTMPAAPGIRRYLERMDFLREVFRTTALDDADATRDDAAPLVECRHYTDDAALRATVRDLLVIIDAKVKTDPLARISLEMALSEIAENVLYHADATHGGFVAAQAFRRTNELEIAIVDLGIGVHASFRKNTELATRVTDDLSAIQMALQPTFTSTPGRNAGLGLAFATLLLSLNEGRLLVRSGEGHVQKGAKEAEKVYDGDSFPGTIVGLRLRTDRPADFKKAYAALDEAIARMRQNDLHYYIRPDETR